MSIQNLINAELDRLDQLVLNLKSKSTGHGIEDVRKAIATISSVASNLRTVANGVAAESVEELDKLVDGLSGGEGSSSESSSSDSEPKDEQ